MEPIDHLLATEPDRMVLPPAGARMISIVVPVFNGARTLKDLYSRVELVMQGMQRDYEIIFVDDGSTDGSWQVITALYGQDKKKVRGFRLARNTGQQAATLCGLLQASGEWIVTLDDDCQSPPEEIPTLWTEAQRSFADIVYGISPHRKDDLLYSLFKGLFRGILHRIAPGYPGESSFRLIRASLIPLLPDESHPWVFVDSSLSQVTDRFLTVVVKQDPGSRGKSRYSFSQLLSLALTLFFVYSIIPMRLMIWSGLMASGVSFGLGIYFLYRKLAIGAPLGFSALIVTVTFTAGAILLSLGVLSEYISRLYIIHTGRKAFTIKTRLA
jgi:glycosyltransferase involved in cell wall biosynthesis